jgi:hypothetical protein
MDKVKKFLTMLHPEGSSQMIGPPEDGCVVSDRYNANVCAAAGV